MPSAIIATAVMVLVTGALHEDGLADTADGLAAGADRERALEIMRDSRIGSYRHDSAGAGRCWPG